MKVIPKYKQQYHNAKNQLRQLAGLLQETTNLTKKSNKFRVGEAFSEIIEPFVKELSVTEQVTEGYRPPFKVETGATDPTKRSIVREVHFHYLSKAPRSLSITNKTIDHH